MGARSGILAILAVLAAFPAAAFGGTVSYPQQTNFSVANGGSADTGATVLGGNPPLQGASVSALQPVWTPSADAVLTLKDPSGAESLVLMNGGCGTMPSGTNFAVNDTAANVVGSPAFCSGQLNGGAGRPADPSKTFAIFAGKPAGGIWVLNAHDLGLQLGGGSVVGWTLNLAYAPVTFKATAKPQHLLSGGRVKFRLEADATCKIFTSGDLKHYGYLIQHDDVHTNRLKLKPKALNDLAGGGTAKVKLHVIDNSGDDFIKTLKIKILG